MEHIFARVIIKDTDNQLLVVQDRPEAWNFPGGKAEAGESPVACAIREVEEEIGLSVLQLTEIYQDRFLFGQTEWHGFFYFAQAVSGIPCMNEPDKIKGLRFVESAETMNFPAQLSAIGNRLFEERHNYGKTYWL